MNRLEEQKGRPRLGELDCLRGIAALVVVFNHYVELVPEDIRNLVAYQGGIRNPAAWLTPWAWLRFSPLRLAVDGHAAVIVFFVLSGFVLTLPVTKQSQPLYPVFLLRRFCRIYIPFAVAILFAAMLFSFDFVRPAPGLSRWTYMLMYGLSNYSVAGHLLMTGRSADIVLDNVMWTLVHEMRMALIMPGLFWAIRRFGVVRTIALNLVVSLAASYGMTESHSGSLLSTLHFSWMFTAGAALSYHRQVILRRLETMNWTKVCSLWLSALFLLMLPFDRVWCNFAIGVGACILVVLCLRRDLFVTHFLVNPLSRWLGRVSYSLYLIHLPIMMFAVSIGVTGVIGFCLALAITFALAEVFYQYIEAPAHALGMYVSAQMRPRLVSRPQG